MATTAMAIQRPCDTGPLSQGFPLRRRVPGKLVGDRLR